MMMIQQLTGIRLGLVLTTSFLTSSELSKPLEKSPGISLQNPGTSPDFRKRYPALEFPDWR